MSSGADVRAVCDRALAADPRCGEVRVVAVDGGAAAGKSSLAAAIATELRERGRSAYVVATDHLLDGWDGQFTFWDRLRSQVLDPLAAGRPGRFARYRWSVGAFDGTEDVPRADVVIVEGVGAVAACNGLAALTVWVELDRPTREARWSQRDGTALLPSWIRWLDAEDAFFAAHPVTADVVVRTDTDPAIRTLASRTVYANPWMQVREDDIAYADGSTGTYGVVVKDDFAAVIAAERGGFWLVQQYRYPVGSREWEFCQGGWSAGRTGTPAELARTELAEEVGLRAGTLVHLGRLFAAYGYSSQSFDVFLATDLTAGGTDREHSEQDMVHRWFPEAEVRAMIGSGRFADAHSLAALTLLDAYRSRAEAVG